MAKKQTKKRSRSSILADIQSVQESVTNPGSTNATAMFIESVMPSLQAELLSRLFDELTALGPDPTFLAGWQVAIDADQAALDEAEIPDAVRYSLDTVLCDSRNHLKTLEAAVTAESLEAAVCAAYDLGESRQRFTLQFLFERAVDAGTRSQQRSDIGNAAIRTATDVAKAAANEKYHQLQEARKNTKDGTLQNMVGMKFGEKTPSLGALRRWARTW